jgi:hypothetical protein
VIPVQTRNRKGIDMNIRKKLYLAGFAAFVVLAAVASAQEAVPTVDEIVARHVEAAGGLEAHNKLTTRTTEGTFTLTAVGVPWKFTTTQKAPDKKHNLIQIPAIGEATEGCDGKVAWKWDPGQKPRQLAGFELEEKLRDTRFHRLLYMVTEGEFSYAGKVEDEGRPCYVLEGSYPPGEDAVEGTFSVHIDEETYLVSTLKFTGMRMAAMDGMTMKLADYKAVDGVQYPFSAALSMKDAPPLFTLKVTEIKHGTPVDDALFAMPPNTKRGDSAEGENVFEEGPVRVSAEVLVDRFDANGDGTVEDAEVEKVFLELQQQAEDSGKTLLRLFDKNKDGSFDTEEKKAIRRFVAGVAGTMLGDDNRDWLLDESELDRAWEKLVEHFEEKR